MLLFQFFNDGINILLLLIIAPALIISLIFGSIYIVYSVFRDRSRKEQDYRLLRNNSKMLSLVFVAFSLAFFFLVKSKWLFDDGLTTNRLLFLTLLIGMMAIFFGVFAVSRWQNFITFPNFLFILLGIFLL